MVTITRQFQSSDLSRSASAVFNAASENPVRITRRDGHNLVLMREDAVEKQQQLLDIAAHIIAVSTVSAQEDELAQEMSKYFPWMLALNAQEQDECTGEVINHARISFSLNNPELILTTLNAWHDTAEAKAAGLTGQSFDEPAKFTPLHKPA